MLDEGAQEQGDRGARDRAMSDEGEGIDPVRVPDGLRRQGRAGLARAAAKGKGIGRCTIPGGATSRPIARLTSGPPAASPPRGPHPAELGGNPLGTRVEAPQALVEGGRDRPEVRLGGDDEVGGGNLSRRLRVPVERNASGRRGHARGDAGKRHAFRERGVGDEERLDRGRVREPARLDEDAGEGRARPRRPPRDEIAEGTGEVSADRAAQAAPRELHHRVVGGLDEQVVDADRAELVDDDRGVAKPLRVEQAVEERRLAASEEPGEDEDGGPPVPAFGPAPRGGGAGFRSVFVRGRRDADPEPCRREVRVEGEPHLAEQLEHRGESLAVERPGRRPLVRPAERFDTEEVVASPPPHQHCAVVRPLRPCLDLPLGERRVEEGREIGCPGVRSVGHGRLRRGARRSGRRPCKIPCQGRRGANLGGARALARWPGGGRTG